MSINFDPEYIRKLIMEANQLLTDDTIDKESRTALQKCLFSIQADQRTFSVCGSNEDSNEKVNS